MVEFKLALHQNHTSQIPPTIRHHYELLPLNPTMQQEYSTLYNEFLSSKSKGSVEFFRNINKLQIWFNHHIILNTMADADLQDHKGTSTRDNSSKITQTIVYVETCIISSKIAQLLKRLLKNKKSKCGRIKSVVYTQFLYL
ncbi:hypothetical protein O181_030044 [Austropuccinia psidii MF-1]|uniref:Uncharacterized protein n=1 Tax=Austropuccinia psidii MF-1 TaxID=1389203 RepID=A0A9Q3H561_9BASI|nr:hypothetical protein [Austropuccinia psidii MF-1]